MPDGERRFRRKSSLSCGADTDRGMAPFPDRACEHTIAPVQRFLCSARPVSDLGRRQPRADLTGAVAARLSSLADSRAPCSGPCLGCASSAARPSRHTTPSAHERSSLSLRVVFAVDGHLSVTGHGHDCNHHTDGRNLRGQTLCGIDLCAARSAAKHGCCGSEARSGGDTSAHDCRGVPTRPATDVVFVRLVPGRLFLAPTTQLIPFVLRKSLVREIGVN